LLNFTILVILKRYNRRAREYYTGKEPNSCPSSQEELSWWKRYDGQKWSQNWFWLLHIFLLWDILHAYKQYRCSSGDEEE
jgi:hypothetical protein